MRVESTDRTEPAEGVDPAKDAPADGAVSPEASVPPEKAESPEKAGSTGDPALGGEASDAGEPAAVEAVSTDGDGTESAGGTEAASDDKAAGAGDAAGAGEPSSAGDASSAEPAPAKPVASTDGDGTPPTGRFGALVHAVRNPRMPRTTLGRITAAALVLVLVAGVAGGLWWNAQRLPAGAALAVGDRVVTVSDLDDRVQTLRALYGVQPPVEDPAKMDGFRRDAAKAVAVSMVLEDKSAEMGVGVADAKVRQTLDQYITQQLGPGQNARAEFVRVLGNVGTSEDKVLSEIRQQMTVSELFNRVTADVTVSDDDLRTAFPQYAERLGKPETRDLSNIVVASKEAADKVAADLRGGADFATVARSTSIDNSTRNAGGAMGPVSAGQLQPGYAQAAFATPSGQVFGPVQNQFGWNVGRVGAITPGVPANYDQVKDRLRPLVEFDRKLAVWSDWMRDSLADGDVRYADDYQPADPDSAPTGGTPGQPPGAANPVPAPGGGE